MASTPQAGRRGATGCVSPSRMNFTTKKRARKDAWKHLQKELDDREKLEEENSIKIKKIDALKARVCVGVLAPYAGGCHQRYALRCACSLRAEEELVPTARYAYMDFEIGRRMGRDPLLSRGRLIVELFDDIMPVSLRASPHKSCVARGLPLCSQTGAYVRVGSAQSTSS